MIKENMTKENKEKLRLNHYDGEASLFPRSEWDVILYSDGVLHFHSADTDVEALLVDGRIAVPEDCSDVMRKWIVEWMKAPSAVYPQATNLEVTVIFYEMMNA